MTCRQIGQNHPSTGVLISAATFAINTPADAVGRMIQYVTRAGVVVDYISAAEYIHSPGFELADTRRKPKWISVSTEKRQLIELRVGSSLVAATPEQIRTWGETRKANHLPQKVRWTTRVRETVSGSGALFIGGFAIFFAALVWGISPDTTPGGIAFGFAFAGLFGAIAAGFAVKFAHTCISENRDTDERRRAELQRIQGIIDGNGVRRSS